MAQVPMGNDIPSNSLKSQQQARTAPQGKPEIPVFEGETMQAKRKGSSFWKWMKKMFLSDRKPRDIVKEIIEFRIVPGIKDNIRNSAMATLDSFIYPGSIGPTSSPQNGVVNYNRIYNSSSQNTLKSTTEQTASTKADEINKGFCNPCFHTQFDAQNFLALMKGYDYPTLSVHTMYMMQKKHIDYTWDAYGWNRDEILALGASSIKPTHDPTWPFMIDLPEAHVIA